VSLYSGMRSGMRDGMRSGIDAGPRQYPLTAAALTAALGYGDFTSGAIWLCDELSGSLQPVHGSPALTAVGTPLYGQAGYLGGGDKAVKIDQAGDRFEGGNVYNVAAASDLLVVMVCKFPPDANGGELLTKQAGAAPRWMIYKNSDPGCNFLVQTASGGLVVIACSPGASQQVVIVAALERATNTMRIGSRTLGGGVSATSADTAVAAFDVTNAAVFKLASSLIDLEVSYAAIGVGVGAATGATTNIATACQNFSRAIGGA
jgi:hypothetical protein